MITYARSPQSLPSCLMSDLQFILVSLTMVENVPIIPLVAFFYTYAKVGFLKFLETILSGR